MLVAVLFSGKGATSTSHLPTSLFLSVVVMAMMRSEGCNFPPCPSQIGNCNFAIESRANNFTLYGPEIRDINQDNLNRYTCSQRDVSSWTDCHGNVSFGLTTNSDASPLDEELQVLPPEYVVSDWIVANVCTNALSQASQDECDTRIGIVELVKRDQALYVYTQGPLHAGYIPVVLYMERKLHTVNRTIRHVINTAEGVNTDEPFWGAPNSQAQFRIPTSSPGKMTLMAHMNEFRNLSSCSDDQLELTGLRRVEFFLEKYVLIVPIASCRHPMQITQGVKLVFFTSIDVDCSSTRPVVTSRKVQNETRLLTETEIAHYQEILGGMADGGWNNFKRGSRYTHYLINKMCTLNPFPHGSLEVCGGTRMEEYQRLHDEL